MLRGLITAVTTPFNADNTIDEGAFVAHFQWLFENGIQRILVGGTTGEFFSLDLEERKRLLRLSTKHFQGHIMFHAGAGCLVDTIELAAFAAGEGAHSIAAILPYYLATVEHPALVAYLNQIAESVAVPFIIYNFPKHTQVKMTPKLLSEVTHFGLKDSSADLSLIPHTPNYFIGSDRQMLQAYAAGAKGFVSGRANVYPELYAQLDAAALKDHGAEATVALHQTVCDSSDTLSGVNQIRLIKEGIGNGVPGYPSKVRLPLI